MTAAAMLLVLFPMSVLAGDATPAKPEQPSDL
jgi:hypothetical protein